MFGPEHAQHCLLCAVSLWHWFVVFVWFVRTCSGATPVKRPIDEEVTPSIWVVFCTWQTISKSAWLHDECRFHSKLGDKYLSLSSFGCASQILMIRNNYVIFDCKTIFTIVFDFFWLGPKNMKITVNFICIFNVRWGPSIPPAFLMGVWPTRAQHGDV